MYLEFSLHQNTLLSTFSLCLLIEVFGNKFVWGWGFTLSRVMAFPENFEQVGKADIFWMEDNSHHLSVACHTCKIQHLWVNVCLRDMSTFL